MNISFHHKIAFGIIAITLSLVALWRYEFKTQDSRQQTFVASLQNELRQRDELGAVLTQMDQIRTTVERIAAQGQVDATVGQSLEQSLKSLLASGEKVFAGEENPIKQLSADVEEFSKISQQLSLYEGKVQEFIGSFETYFRTLRETAGRWETSTTAAIAIGGAVTNTVPFSELEQKVSALERAIPEFSTFKQRMQGLAIGFDQWVQDINAAASVEEKQAAFAKKQTLLKGIPELSDTFKQYIKTAAARERENVQLIALQITASLAETRTQVQDKFAVKNNAVQTIMAQTKYKDDQYRKVKYAVAGLTFVALIIFFFAVTIYTFRFEKGLAIFRRKTYEAVQATREVSNALTDNSDIAVKNFNLAQTLKEGLSGVSAGFLARQGNLQHIDQLVRDTDTLIKESQENFQHIKEEFYNAEKISKEIVNLTGALEGVAQQMTSVAERVASDPTPVEGKEKTIDELKYLSSRIRFAVNATHATLDGRAAKIEEAKAKFTLIENNMAQMTENTQQSLRSLALARLDHSEEVSRVNEILENARNTSRVIVTEIETLNKQINDFSALSKHLAALHELAVKASALNAQSLLPQEEAVAEVVTSSQRMNTYVQEYFQKIFENPALKDSAIVPVDVSKSSRVQAAADV